jgi:hypothetical protein
MQKLKTFISSCCHPPGGSCAIDDLQRKNVIMICPIFDPLEPEDGGEH